MRKSLMLKAARAVIGAVSPLLFLAFGAVSVSGANLSILAEHAGPADHAGPAEEIQQLPAVVIVSDRIETALSDIGASVTIITRRDIQRSQQETVAGLLRETPGLDVVRSGGPGGQVSVFMRGANSGHTLVIIDGIEMNDPSSSNNAYDFSDLRVEGIERIEILRGSQSALYGSEAIGGVINIIMREGGGPFSVELSSEGGSYNSYRAEVSARGGWQSGAYALSAYRNVSDGFSHTDSRAVNEVDGHRLSGFSGKGRLSLGSSLSSKVVFRLSDSQSDLDKGFVSVENPGVFDDPNYVSSYQQSYARGELEWSKPSGKLTLKLHGSLTRHQRELEDFPDAIYGSSREMSSYQGRRSQFGLQGVARIFSGGRLVFGAEGKQETLDQKTDFGFGASEFNDSSAATSGVFALYRHSVPGVGSFTAGARHDDHEVFGGHSTFNASASVYLAYPSTRLKASAGSGFKAPSVWQLYAPFFGNADLAPEESLSWDVGVERIFSGGKAVVSATWFSTDFDSLISYDPLTFKMTNLDQSKSEGAELSVQLNGESARLTMSYTYTLARDEQTGAQLLRRPKNKFRASLFSNIAESVDLSATLRQVGTRVDIGGVPLAAYTTVDLAVTQRIGRKLTLTWRALNLFDRKYSEIANYAAPGLSAYAGLRVEL